MKFSIGEITGLRRPRKWCDGKTRFESRGKADAGLRALRASADREHNAKAIADIDTMRVYECEDREGVHFHIGHWRKAGVEPYERVKRGKGKETCSSES